MEFESEAEGGGEGPGAKVPAFKNRGPDKKTPSRREGERRGRR